MDLTKEVDRNRLFSAMQQSYLKMEPFRNLAAGLVEEYAGSGYGYDNGTGRFETLANLMNQAVDAYVMALVANRPKASISTQQEKLKFFAEHYQIAINNMFQEICLEDVLRRAVLDAFFSMGIVKVHMANTAEVELYDGIWIDPGTPNATNLWIDDFVYDMSATRWDQCKYMADSYRLPLEDLKDDPFDQKVVKQLTPTSKQNITGWAQRVEMFSKGYQTEQDDVEPMVDVMDVWVPRESKIYTFAMDPGARFTGRLGPIAVLDWDGPELGPYHVLSFNTVPDNIMPASPASQLSGLSRLINNVFRKQGRQAKRQKDVFIYTPGGSESAKRIQRTNDGEWVEVQDTSDVGTLKMGGVDSGNQAFLFHLIDTFDRMAGNLPSMLGLGPQADTLGQEQLIDGANNRKLAQMRTAVIDFTRKLARNMAWMLWHDKVKVIPGRMSIPGLPGETIDATWSPNHRMGEFFDYDLDIDVFSMPYQAPGAKVQQILQLVQQVFLPMSQQLQSQGGRINLQALTDCLAEAMNNPQLKEVVEFGAPAPEPQQGSPEPPAASPATTRNYVRRNVATGGTPAQRSMTNQQAWLTRAAQQGGNAA